MPSLLIRHATLLVAMDDADSRWADGGLYVEGNVIRQVGPTDALPAQADRVNDARDTVILPGLGNTHHHIYQTPTPNLPAAQDATPFTWQRTQHPLTALTTPQPNYD